MSRSHAVALAMNAAHEEARSASLWKLLLAAALTVVLLAAVAAPALAQETRVITFNDAVRIALERNVELRKAGNSVEAQATTVATERADFLPNLNLQTGPSRNYGLYFDQTSGRLTQATSTNFSVGGSSNINLFNGFEDVASLQQARMTLEAGESTLERTRQDVLFQVVQAYLEVLLDSQQVNIRLEDVEAQRQQLAQIEAFVEVGQRPVSDLYQQQASLAASELQLLEQERALQLSKMGVIQVLELDPFVTYEFEAPAIEDLELAPESFDLEEMLRRAFTQRADLAAQDLRIDAAEQGIRVARAGALPSLSLNARYGSDYSSNFQRRLPDDTFEDISFTDQLNENRGGNLSFGLSIPIFNRLQVRNNVQRARVQYRNAELDLQNLQQGVALDVRQAYLDYQTAVKRLDATAKQLQASEQALAAEEERYNVGAATLVELTQARSNYVAAASNRAQAIYRFLFQNSVIEYQMGTLDPTVPLF